MDRWLDEQWYLGIHCPWSCKRARVSLFAGVSPELYENPWKQARKVDMSPRIVRDTTDKLSRLTSQAGPQCPASRLGGDSRGSLFSYLLMRTTYLLRHILRHPTPLRHPCRKDKGSYENRSFYCPHFCRLVSHSTDIPGSNEDEVLKLKPYKSSTLPSIFFWRNGDPRGRKVSLGCIIKHVIYTLVPSQPTEVCTGRDMVGDCPTDPGICHFFVNLIFVTFSP